MYSQESNFLLATQTFSVVTHKCVLSPSDDIKLEMNISLDINFICTPTAESIFLLATDSFLLITDKYSLSTCDDVRVKGKGEIVPVHN
jgi:hypothetical protein